MKFKVGDKVRVKSVTSDEKKKYLGNIATITDIAGTCIYPYAVFENDYWWRDNELELVNEEFTKSDLKDGMVVEYRNGARKMVLQNGLFDKICYTPIGLFNDNLEYTDNIKSFTIDKIYISKAVSLNNYFKDDNLELIWKRPAKKMTIAEIEKELGYKIEIVDNKEE